MNNYQYKFKIKSNQYYDQFGQENGAGLLI